MSLRSAPLSERVFATSFLTLLGLAYTVALGYLLGLELLPHLREGRGVVGGIERSFAGGGGQTRLESVLQGSMAFAVRNDDFTRFQHWIRSGATREGYQPLDAIVQLKCANCHKPGGNPPMVRNFEEVRLLLQVDEGRPAQALARTTHVHLFTIPLMLFPLGLLFIRTRYPERWKAILVALPFAAVAWEVLNWWLTRAFPSAAWGILLGGLLLCAAFTAQWVLCLLDLWRPLPGPEA